jgi:hypothetical protein
MANYVPATSPVISKLLAPLFDAYGGSLRKYACTEPGDLDFLESGVSRCLSAVASGREFLQNLMILLEDDIEKKEGIDNAPERERKVERLEEAKESGAGYVATMMQRFTFTPLACQLHARHEWHSNSDSEGLR